MNPVHLLSDIVDASVMWCCWCLGRYLQSTFTNKNNAMIKQKVNSDKSELNYGGDTCRKIGIDESNAPTL